MRSPLRHLAIGIAVGLVAAATSVALPTAGALNTASGRPTANVIAAGDAHTCVVKADSTVWCWGSNFAGQLGDGTNDDSVAPVQVSGLTDAVEVAATSNSTCARVKAGQVWCWGQGGDGELGDGLYSPSSAPVTVSGITDAISITAGRSHACAVLSGGSIRCWGGNSHSQLGDKTDIPAGTPVDVVGMTDAVSLAAGDYHTCAVRVSGEAACWGYNGDGQLGDGTTNESLVPVAVRGLTDIAEFTAGSTHTCARLDSGEAWCWGDGYYGQLGDGTLGGNPPSLHHVLLADRVIDLTARGDDTCAITADGQAFCWGDGRSGHLGNGTEDVQYAIPTAVTGVGDAVAIASGANHACSLRVSGTVACWGDSGSGQVGSGLPDQVLTATMVPNLVDVAAVSAGSDSTCALMLSGTVQCWGSNDEGELGNGSFLRVVGPAAVPNISTATALDVGYRSTCVALVDATMRCWGDNGSGQLGDGTKNSSPVPVTPPLANVDRIATGTNHSCGRVTGGDVYCWGSNSSGQLGDGSGAAEQLTPTIVPSLSNGGGITIGGYHTCSRLFNSQVMCWGRNSVGQVGDGGTGQKDVPTPVDITINSFLQVDAGDNHTCASRLLHMYCWGYNGNGQLGDNSVMERHSPTLVPGVPGGQVSAGQFHTCLTEATGIVDCWGANYNGQLGDGTTGERHVPTEVLGLTDVTQVSAGGYHSCAVRSDGTVWCWGENVVGQLGQPSYFTTPVEVAGITGPVPPPEIPLVPARLLDTRPGETTVDGQYAGQGQRQGGSTLELPISGRGGVPTGAAAAVVNVTAVNAAAPGYVTVYPCDTPRPLASSLNFTPGTATPNEVIAKLSATGTICLFTQATVDLVVDVTGWLPPLPTYTPLVPARLLDTRSGESTVDGQYAGQGQQQAGTTFELPVAGRGGVPTGAPAAVVNITAVNAAAPGFVTVYPCDAARPLASSLNYSSSAATPNELVAKLSATGTICLFTLAAADLIVDVTGALPATPGFTPLVPARLLDTRPGESTVDGQYAGIGRPVAGSTLELPITGRGGAPSGASAAIINVTAVGAAASGYVTVYPCDTPRPLASSLNYAQGAATANELVAKLSATGTICLYTLAASDLIVDVTGIFM